MRIFIGRSSKLWLVEPHKGKVRRLPFTLPGLIFVTILTVGAAAFGLDLLNRTGLSPKAWYEVVLKAQSVTEIDQKSKELYALVARLQQEKDQATRLNQRLASKLENLEGAIGSVASQVIPGNNVAPSKNHKLLKPASYNGGRLGLNQRLTIRKVDRIINQLKELPHHPPVEYPQVNSHFGHRHSPNGIGTTFHRGVDFSLRRSDKVLSAGNGVVANVSYMRGYGLYIDILHGKDIVTRYAHLANTKVSKGQKIIAGQHIGTGGSTGAATGRHLHFEVLVKGRSRDPLMFLSIPQKLQFALRDGQVEGIQTLARS